MDDLCLQPESCRRVGLFRHGHWKQHNLCREVDSLPQKMSNDYISEGIIPLLIDLQEIVSLENHGVAICYCFRWFLRKCVSSSMTF